MKMLQITYLDLASKCSAAALAMALAGHANVALAQAGAAGAETVSGPDDIIVTAQRREQTALKVPLSLTALDESLISDKQVSALNDLQFVAPGIRSGQLRSGTVGHNSWRSDMAIGFGGFTQSGVGREGGVNGLRAFLEPKTIIMDNQA